MQPTQKQFTCDVYLSTSIGHLLSFNLSHLQLLQVVNSRNRPD